MPSRDINKLVKPFRESVGLMIERAHEKGIPVEIAETTRTIEEQREYMRRGVSWTMESKHLTGEAVDVYFDVNGRTSYDANLFEELYKIVKDIPYVIWSYRDLGWGIDKPHFQFDPTKKPVYNKDMSQVEELKAQVRRLHDEVRKLTKEVHNANRGRSDAELALEREKNAHLETLEKSEYHYREWQKCLDEPKDEITPEQSRGLKLVEYLRSWFRKDG